MSDTTSSEISFEEAGIVVRDPVVIVSSASHRFNRLEAAVSQRARPTGGSSPRQWRADASRRRLPAIEERAKKATQFLWVGQRRRCAMHHLFVEDG